MGGALAPPILAPGIVLDWLLEAGKGAEQREAKLDRAERSPD